MATQSVKRADYVFGSLYRRLKSRLDKAQAMVATAHAIVRVVYRILKYQVEYETISVEKYEQKYKEQQIKYMKKTCVEPVETKPGSSVSNSCPLNKKMGREKASST